MSGPVDERDRRCDNERLDGVEARGGRQTSVGGLNVRRVLPTKGRRTVGAWCFTDLMGPADAEQPDPMEVGPHPHIGLSTVTWLIEGEALHTDSLGTEQVIRPGQLNWMTAGRGIAHAELAARPPFMGAQMWVAQPEATRHDAPSFQHVAELPQVDQDDATVRLFAGTFADETSEARTDTPLVGLDVEMRRGGAVLPTAPDFEHAVIPLDAAVRVGPEIIEPGWIALVPPGVDELPIETRADEARMLVVGGAPFPERIQMWWNFVARDRHEFDTAWRDWQERTDRFGGVSSRIPRIDAPRPPWMSAASD